MIGSVIVAISTIIAIILIVIVVAGNLNDGISPCLLRECWLKTPVVNCSMIGSELPGCKYKLHR